MSENVGSNGNGNGAESEEKAIIETVTYKVPSPAEFFEKYTLVGVANWNEIHVLGRNNVKYLLARARSMEKERTDKIDRLQNYKGVFEAALKFADSNEHLTVADYFEELSHQYDNPQFQPNEIGEREGNWSHDPEPLTKESETRKPGTTNFNICGWCGHAGGGSCRFGYHMTTTCSFLDTYDEQICTEVMKQYGDHTSRELRFNTPCLLKQMAKHQCKGVIASIEKAIHENKLRRDGIRAVINILIDQRKKAGEVKPWIVNNRPCEYMNVGDAMMVYLGGWKETIVRGDWVKAIGIFGYRHQDGCMSYQAEFPIHTNASYFEGRGGGAGMSRPEAMLATEFAMLTTMAQKVSMKYAKLMKSVGIEDPDVAFLRIWFQNLERQELKGFDCTKFFEALKDPQIATPPEGWTPPTDEIKVETAEDAQRVLQCLDWKYFNSEEEIGSWVMMQLKLVHPDKHQQASPEVQSYAARQTRAVIAARDLLLNLYKVQKG